MCTRRRGQSMIEYSILLAIVVALISIAQIYMKRGIQAGVKISADQLGDQSGAATYYDPVKGRYTTGMEEEEMSEGGSRIYAGVERTATPHGTDLSHSAYETYITPITLREKNERGEIVDTTLDRGGTYPGTDEPMGYTRDKSHSVTPTVYYDPSDWQTARRVSDGAVEALKDIYGNN